MKQMLIIVSFLVFCGNNLLAKAPQELSIREDTLSLRYPQYFGSIDSAFYVSFDGSELFKIVKGGSQELEDDFLFNVNGHQYHFFAISDLSQEVLMYFVLYDYVSGKLYQTNKIYLPNVDIDYYSPMIYDDINIKKGNLLIKVQHKQLKEVLHPIDLDRYGILNYQELN